MTIFDLSVVHKSERFRLKNGYVIWEAVSYVPNIDKCYVSRIVEHGGKPFMLGLRYKSMYIDPKTEIIVL